MDTPIHFRKFSDWPDERGVTVDSCEGFDGLWWIVSDKGAWTGPLLNWTQDSTEFMSQVKNFDTVITAGGNCGMYVKFYGNYFKNIYTWEPNAENYACLDLNCADKKFHKYFGGLGSESKKLSISPTKTGKNVNVGTYKIIDNPGDVQMYRIDDLNLPSCDLIHLDVEGYEAAALRGAIETIKKFKPVVIIERDSGANVVTDLGYTKYKKLMMDSVYIYK